MHSISQTLNETFQIPAIFQVALLTPPDSIYPKGVRAFPADKGFKTL